MPVHPLHPRPPFRRRQFAVRIRIGRRIHHENIGVAQAFRDKGARRFGRRCIGTSDGIGKTEPTADQNEREAEGEFGFHKFHSTVCFKVRCQRTL